MSRLATGAAAVVVGMMLLHGQRTATSQPSALLPETSVWRMSMGPDPGGKSGTQAGAAVHEDLIAWWNGPASASSNGDEAEYQQERRACESLAGDARNHCLEYAKLRYGRT